MNSETCGGCDLASQAEGLYEALTDMGVNALQAANIDRSVLWCHAEETCVFRRWEACDRWRPTMRPREGEGEWE